MYGIYSMRKYLFAQKQLIRVFKGHTPTELSFDTIFEEECTQEDVYNRVRASIEAVLQGINSAIFA